MRMGRNLLSVWVGVLLVASACADRFGSIGEYGQLGFAGSDPDENGTTAYATTTYSSAYATTTYSSETGIGEKQCKIVPWPMLTCDYGEPVMQFDEAGCPAGYACQPSSTTTKTTTTQGTSAGGGTYVTGNTTCIDRGSCQLCFVDTGSGGTRATSVVGSGTNMCGETSSYSLGTATCLSDGCIASCAFVDGGGGAPTTKVIGDTSCNAAGGSGSHSTTTVGDASCYTRGCQTFCMFHDGGGGTSGLNTVGRISCQVGQTGPGTFTTSHHYFRMAAGGTSSSSSVQK